jgi:hypothetical protein
MWPTCQLGAERGKGGLRQRHFPVMEVETERGAGAARGPAGSAKEGGNTRRSGSVRRPGLAGLISIWKNQKGFDF